MKEAMLRYGVLLFGALIGGCRAPRSFSEQDIASFITKRNVPGTTRLTGNGFYNDEAASKRIYGENGDSLPFIGTYFFDNGMVCAARIVFDLEKEAAQYQAPGPNDLYDRLKHWGVYSIRGDSIEVLTYRFYVNEFKLPHYEERIAKYRGIIQNDSTIINWRQVDPDPGTSADQLDTVPRTLQFMPYSGKQWINTGRSAFYKRFLAKQPPSK